MSRLTGVNTVWNANLAVSTDSIAALTSGENQPLETGLYRKKNAYGAITGSHSAQMSV